MSTNTLSDTPPEVEMPIKAICPCSAVPGKTFCTLPISHHEAMPKNSPPPAVETPYCSTGCRMAWRSLGARALNQNRIWPFPGGGGVRDVPVGTEERDGLRRGVLPAAVGDVAALQGAAGCGTRGAFEERF